MLLYELTFVILLFISLNGNINSIKNVLFPIFIQWFPIYFIFIFVLKFIIKQCGKEVPYKNIIEYMLIPFYLVQMLWFGFWCGLGI